MFEMVIVILYVFPGPNFCLPCGMYMVYSVNRSCLYLGVLSVGFVLAPHLLLCLHYKKSHLWRAFLATIVLAFWRPNFSIFGDYSAWVGKMLFARQGKKFDYDLKQLRFSDDLLMELGAGIELATAAVPHLFLPLACVANVAKNVGAVTSTSTHTPIYKAFAKGENIGDVTVKGECVGNIADLV
ncbi:protein root UVB sensitive 6-like [Camellia sinensis]|uniref:protein root UVB sensitive 6-like n=1 Tax=Camellia sinensis TaxID=4442 RepID=UPI0010364C89|nr:protein root UVB sensitive 6-like [Camellia sinensis]